MTSLIKMSEVDVFAQMTPFSAISPILHALLLILGPKNSLKGHKNRYFCSIVALLRLQNVFSMLLRFRLSGRLYNKADYIALKEPFKGCFEGFLRLKRGFFYGKCAEIRSKQPHCKLKLG